MMGEFVQADDRPGQELKMGDDAQFATDFGPSRNQIMLLSAAQESSYGGSVKSWCVVAGVRRRTYYRWFKDPCFVEWWLAGARHYFGLRLPRVYAAIWRSAVGEARGDKDYLPKRRKEVTGRLQHHQESIPEERNRRLHALLDSIERAEGKGRESK